MRNLRTMLRNVTIASCLATAPLALTTTTTASAEPTTNVFQIPLVWNTGIWICSGIHTFCSTSPTAITGEEPGLVSFPFTVTNPDGYYWVHWTNFSTLQRGMATLKAGESDDLYTGTGLVSASITNGRESLAGTGVFWVP